LLEAPGLPEDAAGGVLETGAAPGLGAAAVGVPLPLVPLPLLPVMPFVAAMPAVLPNSGTVSGSVSKPGGAEQAAADTATPTARAKRLERSTGAEKPDMRGTLSRPPCAQQ
jgi:hypothetical protein